MPASNSSHRSAPRSAVLAFFGSALTLAVVFALAYALAAKVVNERYPAPEQAAVWSMIGVVVAATVAIAAAAQAWWLIRRK